MDEDKIVLDRKSFNALAVDSRVRILKSLRERRKTLSEIAEEQKMSVSGVKEHLEILEGVGLIEKMDDGHKWKYYELTRKGREIVAPRELRVWILLSIAAIALVASMAAILSVPTALPQPEAAPTAAMIPPVPENSSGIAAAPMLRATNQAENSTEGEGPAANPEKDLQVPIAVGVISGAVILCCGAILIKNRLKAD